MDANAQELLAQIAAHNAALEAKIEQQALENEQGGGDLFPIPLVGVTKAEITINNGETDVTILIKRYRPNEKKDKLERKRPPKWFWVNVRDVHSRFGDRPVAIIRCVYENPAEADRIDEDESSDDQPSVFGPEARELKVPFAIPEYKFELRNPRNLDGSTIQPVTDRAVIYAAHLVFLRLSGVNLATEQWTDACGILREPTDRYEFQRVTSCMACGRKLVKPSSIDDGFGPICSAKLKKKYDTKTLKWKRPS